MKGHTLLNGGRSGYISHIINLCLWSVCILIVSLWKCEAHGCHPPWILLVHDQNHKMSHPDWPQYSLQNYTYFSPHVLTPWAFRLISPISGPLGWRLLAMFAILSDFWSWWVFESQCLFEIQYIFYIYSISQFGLATFQVVNSHMWLLTTVFGQYESRNSTCSSTQRMKVSSEWRCRELCCILISTIKSSDSVTSTWHHAFLTWWGGNLHCPCLWHSAYICGCCFYCYCFKVSCSLHVG